MLLSTYSRNKLPSFPYSIVMLPSRTTGLPVCIPVQIHECCLELVELLRALMPSAGIQTLAAMRLSKNLQWEERDLNGGAGQT